MESNEQINSESEEQRIISLLDSDDSNEGSGDLQENKEITPEPVVPASDFEPNLDQALFSFINPAAVERIDDVNVLFIEPSII